MRLFYIGLALCGLAVAQDTAANPPAPAPAVAAPQDPLATGPGLYASFETSMGTIVVRLLEDRAPKTVRNFVDLATGAKPSLDFEQKNMVKKHYYDGLIFHRVIRGFMIQTGDVRATGDSDCGVDPLPDEIDPSIGFAVAGRLAMANLGEPDTGACQIFITVGPARHLNATFTIFGVVASGQDVADKIASVPVGGQRPIVPVTVNRVTIARREN